MSLDPNNVLGYAIFLSTQLRQEEAIALVEGVLERIPDDPYVHINAAWRFYGIRDYERALAEVELAEDHNDAGQVRGWSLFSLGATDEAVAVFEGNVRHSDRQPIDLSNLAVVYAETGRRDEARDLLGEMLALVETRYVSPILVADIYFALDEVDEGFDWLDRGLEMRSREMVFLQINHSYDGVRDDPRYLRLLGEMGFPPVAAPPTGGGPGR